tara:strand:+ start:160 stop:471 length:312 start_codon:yes stop_codon:yes gene_type:complete
VSTNYQISYDSSEEGKLKGRFGGDLDVDDISESRAYVESHIDDLVNQSLTTSIPVEYTFKKLRYKGFANEVTSIRGSETVYGRITDTLVVRKSDDHDHEDELY